MKKFILLLMTCSSILSVKAQSITVTNNTGCTIYYELYGDYGCGTNYISQVLSIAPTSTVVYTDPTTVPGGLTYGALTLNMTGIFYAARMYNDDPNSMNCTITSNKVKDLNCYGAGANIANHYTSNPSTCNDECSVQFTLTGTTVRRMLTFN